MKRESRAGHETENARGARLPFVVRVEAHVKLHGRALLEDSSRPWRTRSSAPWTSIFMKIGDSRSGRETFSNRRHRIGIVDSRADCG
jgi:hypothetical protein